MAKFLFAAIAAIFLTGCTASQILTGYVDQTLTEAVFDYGPPTASFDLGDGMRAFIWARTNSYVIPGSSTTNASANAYGGYGYANVYGIATTTSRPPVAGTYTCNYVLIAQKNNSAVEGPAGWTVVGYRIPKGMIC